MAQCGHEGCNCEAGPDGYCGDYCKKHGGHEGHVAHACGCGHPGCEAAKAGQSSS